MDSTILLAGFAGGFVRGLVGFTKYKVSIKDLKVKWWYFLLLVLISGLIGLSAGWIAKGIQGEGEDFSIFYSFIAGYAGGDFIENLYKILVKKTSLYSIAETVQPTK